MLPRTVENIFGKDWKLTISQEMFHMCQGNDGFHDQERLFHDESNTGWNSNFGT